VFTGILVKDFFHLKEKAWLCGGKMFVSAQLFSPQPFFCEVTMAVAHPDGSLMSFNAPVRVAKRWLLKLSEILLDK